MPNLLDMDPSILERNLLLKGIQEGDDEASVDSLFNIKPKEPDNIPWKPVKPTPGYCVKLRTHEGDKVFVNVCHTDAIPEPEEISEDRLLQMIMDDDVPTFRIPISISDLHIESDNSRNPCSVYDIAVNSKFFKKMNSSEVFNTFFLNASIQGLQEKYSLDLDLKSEKPFLILKNRKVLGNLQVHRIQQREVKKAPGQLIQEITSKSTPKKNLIEVVGENESMQKPEKVISTHQTKSTSQPIASGTKTLGSDIKQKDVKNDSSMKNVKHNSSSSQVKGITVPSPSEESEKGIKESLQTKEKVGREVDRTRLSNYTNEEKLNDVRTSEIDDDGREVELDEGRENCSGLFCLKQHPDKGFPELLIASLRLNVKSSKDFDLELDTNRVNITVKGSDKPWFDVYLPYNIDVNKVEACFITESQKLLIKMDVVKS